MLDRQMEAEWDEITEKLKAAGYQDDDVEMGRVTTTRQAYQHLLLTQSVEECKACPLSKTCLGPVPGVGANRSPVMIVGEAPGEMEDRYGIPLIGASGQVLSLVLAKLGIDRSECYVTNAVKCRPEDNRTPHVEEIEACAHHLFTEISIVKPKVILTLGNIAMHVLRMNNKLKITQERGKWQTYQHIAMMHTYHPSYLLRKKGSELVECKKEFWGDVSEAFARAKAEAPYYDFRGMLPMEDAE